MLVEWVGPLKAPLRRYKVQVWEKNDEEYGHHRDIQIEWTWVHTWVPIWGGAFWLGGCWIHKTLRPLSAFFLFCASGKDSHSQAGSAIKTPDIFIHSGGRWIHQADLGARHLLCQRENCALPPGKHCPTHLTLIFILWYLYLSVFHYKYQSYKYERNTAGKSAVETVTGTAVVRRHLHLEGKRIPSNPSAFLLRAGAT